MADHLHRQIRDKIETALTGLTTSATRVYANRLQPMIDANLPGLRIYADDEAVEAQTIHTPYLMERALRLTVECCAKAASNLDDTLDLMSKEVEIALAAGITMSSRLYVPVYAGMNYDDEQADKPVGVKRLNFVITYACMSNAPDTLS